jgi:dolichol-phosphate mannosyltransferase
MHTAGEVTASEGQQASDTRVSVVVPAWDEAATIPELLTRLRKVLEPCTGQLEILVVVPTPDDATHAPAVAHGARVLIQKRPGYGGALREGLQAARGEWVITMDGDLSHPPEAVASLLAHRHAADVVIASRYVARGSAAMSLRRRFLSQLLNLVFRRALAIPVRDMSSGFRLYRRDILSELRLEGESYDVLEEILVQLYTLGRNVIEVPFDYADRALGDSHADVVRFTPHFLSTLARLWRMRNSVTAADYDSRAHDSIVLPQRYWQRRRFQIVKQLAGERAGRRLDVGCASSRIIQSQPDSVGMDILMAKLRFLRRTNRLLVRGDLFHLPFASGAFSTVICSQVIEHVRHDRGLFVELNRVLEPNGTLVIGTPDYGRAWWRLVEWIYKRVLPNAYADEHITHYTRYSLTEELAEAGFAIRDYRYVLGGELVVQCEKREESPADSPGSPAPPATDIEPVIAQKARLNRLCSAGPASAIANAAPCWRSKAWTKRAPAA